MSSYKSLRLLLSGLRCSLRPHAVMPSLLLCCAAHLHDAAKRATGKDAPTYNITNSNVYVTHITTTTTRALQGQPVGWDAVAISPEAKALLQQHAIKASTALKMSRILGFEDVDDVQRLTPDLIAQLNLQPLQLGPLLAMLQQPQPGADGLHQAHKQQPATALKPLEHSGMCYMAISPDGRTALVTSDRCELEAWDLATDTRIAVMAGHQEYTDSVTITPDGSKAVCNTQTTTLRVWDLAIYRCIATLEGHTDCAGPVAITPDGWTAVSGSRDKTLRLWDLAMCTCIATLEGHTDCVRSVAISPDGRTVVSGSFDHTLRVWDLATHRCTATLEGHTGRVMSVAITPDGRTAVSGSDDQTLRLWDLATHACTATLEGHTGTVICLALTPDGRHAVSGSDDSSLRLWDLASRTCITTLKVQGHCICSVLITPDGRYMVETAYLGSTSRVWDLAAYLDTASEAAVQR